MTLREQLAVNPEFRTVIAEWIAEQIAQSHLDLERTENDRIRGRIELLRQLEQLAKDAAKDAKPKETRHRS